MTKAIQLSNSVRGSRTVAVDKMLQRREISVINMETPRYCLYAGKKNNRAFRHHFKSVT